MTQMDSESLIGSSSTSSSSIQTTTSSTMANNLLNQSTSLIQQYNWYYDKSELKRTPSIILDNYTAEKERSCRNDGARFILNVGSNMKLRYDTLATGVVYFHRFYMRHSFERFPKYVTAACCLFLAGKAEETPKKCRDIIKIAKELLDPKQFETFGDDPREEVLTIERIVLQTIRFDLQVEHPYKYLVLYAKCFKGNKDNIQVVLQMAWTFTNDSLCTTICLQWEPEIVAIAMIFLASKIRYEITDWEGRLPHQKHWWDIYVEDLNVELLEDICHQVLDLYSKPNEEINRSPPQPPSSLSLQPNTPTNSTNSPKTPNFSGVSGTTPIKFQINPMGSNNVVGTSALATGAQQLQSMGQFRPITNNSTIANIQSSGSNLTNTNAIPPPPPPPSAQASTFNTASLAAAAAHHQWDPNLATFYHKYQNYPLVGSTKTLLGPVHHMVPPPPPPPPPVIGQPPPPPSLGAVALSSLGVRLPPTVVVPPPPPPPPVAVILPPFVSGVNNPHQST